MINPKRKKRIDRATERKTRRKQIRGMKPEWKKGVLGNQAFNAIHALRRVAKILNDDPNPAVFAIARKGVMAERAIRIACEESGLKLPNPVAMKAVPHAVGDVAARENNRQTPTYRKALENSATALAEHIKKSRIFPKIAGKRTILLIEDKSVLGRMLPAYELALKKAVPGAKVEAFSPFQLSGADIPIEFDRAMPEMGRGAGVLEYPTDTIYERGLGVKDITSTPLVKRWQIDLRKEIRRQLREKKTKGK